MITDAFLNIIFFTLQAIVSVITILPDVTLPNAIIDGVEFAKPYYMSLAVVFPVATLLAIIVIEIVIDTAIFTYRLIKWGYQKLPFIN